MTTTFINRNASHMAPTYYRQPTYTPPPRQVADVRDDYERWYTETVPNNRMTLSLKSSIHSETTWALDRLCRLVHNDQFSFRTIPGVIDALFDWPLWYVTEGFKHLKDADLVFSSKPETLRQHRFALESLFVLRNGALHEPNARDLYSHRHTMSLILYGLYNLDHAADENVEALLHILDIFNLVASKYYMVAVNPPLSNPLPPLLRIVSESQNRTLIMSAMEALASLLGNPANALHLSPKSPALTAAIRYLPLIGDKGLIEPCLNYLHCHISHPSMARAFLLHPEMPYVLRVLTTLILHEQHSLEKTFTLDKSGPIYAVPSSTQVLRNYELSKEEMDEIVAKSEPERCFEWMKAVFVAKPDGEVTQVDFWTLYKDAFTPYMETTPMLVASEVIKNVTQVFPQAQAMVLPTPVQRFIVRGVDRRKESPATGRFRCQWDRSQCAAPPYTSPSDLYDHILSHIEGAEEAAEHPCLWATCPQVQPSKTALVKHFVTHLSSAQPPEKHPSQSDTITLPGENYPYPTPNPTARPPPPPRNTIISYQAPIADPPSTSLTALLVMRILHRTSFASADAAPRADADHFGFPGLLEDTEEPEQTPFEDAEDAGAEQEGERRGRKAFLAIRNLLENVKIRDEALMGWVTEMITAD